jgi:thymidylate synthase
MNRLDKDYQKILQDILILGKEKGDRTGTGTISVFGKQIRHDMSEGFPLLTTKKIAIKTMMTELKWFLKGDTNIKYLVDNNCHIWDGDAYKLYESTYIHDLDKPLSSKDFIQKIKTDKDFANVWGNLGPIYGRQWRGWFNYDSNVNPIFVDQIKELIEQLKTNPDSRRLMVSAWNVGDLHKMTLPPCHYGFQLYTRDSTREEKIVNPGKYKVVSLMWNQRSVDTFLGLPFNIASYGMLLTLLAEEVGMIPGELIGNLGDTHLYSNHVEQAREQIERISFDLPKIKVSNLDILNGEWDYEIKDYEYHPTIKAPLSN